MPRLHQLISRVWLFLVVAVGLSGTALAQNTSGVSGPAVREGERRLELRSAFVPGEDGGEDRFAQRANIAFALDTRRRINLIVQGADRGGPDGFDFDYAKAEFLLELTPESARRWQSGLRFDATLRNGGRADSLGINWLNQFLLGEAWSARAGLYASKAFGDNASDGVRLEARSSLSYDAGGLSYALLSFNSIGSTEDFGLRGNRQQLGPTVSGPLGAWSWTAGSLFGLNDASPDSDFRLWFARRF